jgi:hypothetical protein
MPEIPTPNAHNPIKVAIKSDAIRPQYGYRYDGNNLIDFKNCSKF